MFDWHGLVRTVEVVEINMINSKALDRLAESFFDVGGVRANEPALFLHKPELGGEKDVIALSGALEPAYRVSKTVSRIRQL
jgi:hypothetical protein